MAQTLPFKPVTSVVLLCILLALLCKDMYYSSHYWMFILESFAFSGIAIYLMIGLWRTLCKKD